MSIIIFMSPWRSWLYDTNTLQTIFTPQKSFLPHSASRNCKLKAFNFHTNNISLLWL